jgi:hypothetical protein
VVYAVYAMNAKNVSRIQPKSRLIRFIDIEITS